MDCYFHAVLMVKNYTKLKNVGISSIFGSKGVVYLGSALEKSISYRPRLQTQRTPKTITRFCYERTSAFILAENTSNSP